MRIIEKSIRDAPMMKGIITNQMNVIPCLSSLITPENNRAAAMFVSIRQIHPMVAVMIVNRRTDSFSVFFPSAESAFKRRKE